MPAPDPSRFDWSLVRGFLAVVEAGSLSAAARRLGTLQPTLSRQVAELESQLGAALFERTGRGVLPTAAGRAIVESARQMESGAVELGRALATATGAEAGTVRITSSEIAAAWLLPPILARLHEAAPGIAVELVASNELTNLLRREADIAVRMVRPAQGSLVARRLGEIAIVAAAHRSYLERHGVPRRPGDLLHHRLIGFDRDDSMRAAFARAGFPVGREAFAFRTDAHLAYGRLVAAGAGIGFVARYCLAQWPGVVEVLPGLPLPTLPCWLAVHREIRSSRTVRQVVDFLARAIPPALEATTPA